MTTLPKLRAGLRFNRLDNQVLVYDPRSDAVHLLDPTTTLLTDLLRNGEDAPEIETELGRCCNAESSEDLIALALDELRKADLLDESIVSTPRLPEVGRRELLRKVTLAGASALLIPAVVTLSPRLAYGQGSCRAKKECCATNSDCCSNKCGLSTTDGCQTGPMECH